MPSLPRIRRSKFFPLLSTLVLFLSVVTGVVLVQEQQELREKAQTQTSCLSRSGPVVTKSGSQQSSWDTRSSPIAKSTKIDARTASWVGVSDYPIFLTGDPNVCFAGGLIQGNYPEKVGDAASTWDSTHSTAGMIIQIPNFTLEGTRIHNYGDTIRFTDGANFFTVTGVHFSHIRDDCIENDYYHTGLFDDSLLDGCYTAFSANRSGDGSKEIMTVQNTLVRMEPMQGVYKNKGLIPGHGPFFKWNSEAPKLILKNNVFRADQESSSGSSGGLGLPKDKVIECSNNVMVWLGPGSSPPLGSDEVPLTTSIGGKPCFTITKDISVWDNAKSDWLKRHGEISPPPPSTPTPITSPTPTPTKTPTPTPTFIGPTPTPPSIPSNAFRGQYYDGKNFNTLTHTRIDAAIDFDWGFGSPAPGVGVDSFSVRWEGDWDFTQAGTYRFTAETDDGMRVFVDGQQIIDAWKNQPVTVYTGDILLSAGTHRVKVEYYEAHSPAIARLSWELVSTATPTALPNLPGDINGDGVVNILDYQLLTNNFGSTNCGNKADIDGDCDVDIFDYNALVTNFGQG